MNENKLVIPFLSTLVVVLSATITFMVVQKTNSKVAVAVKKDAQTETTDDDESDIFHKDEDANEDDTEEELFHIDSTLKSMLANTKDKELFALRNQLIDCQSTINELERTVRQMAQQSESKIDNYEAELRQKDRTVHNLQQQLATEQRDYLTKLFEKTVRINELLSNSQQQTTKTTPAGGKKRRSKTVRRRQK